MDDGVSFAQIDFDGSERFQALRRELGVTTFGLNLMLLQPGQAGRIHRHEHQEEVYVVLDGELSLYVEGEEHVLGQGALARVAPNVRRQLVNRRPRRVVLLALGGAADHTGRDGVAFDSWQATEGATPQEIPLPPDVPVLPA
jgi:uncharacterized cupin superfamily protein